MVTLKERILDHELITEMVIESLKIHGMVIRTHEDGSRNYPMSVTLESGEICEFVAYAFGGGRFMLAQVSARVN